MKKEKFKLVIPQEIIIFGDKWKIECLEEVKINDSIKNGLINFKTKTIKINYKSTDNVLGIFCHELGHCMSQYFYGTEVNDKEEFACIFRQFVAPVFEQILKASQKKPKSLKQIEKDLTNTRNDATKTLKMIRNKIRKGDKKK